MTQRTSRRLAIATAIIIAFGLAGCGFTPLYATPGVSPNLAAITVAPPQGRMGYLLREDLDDAFGRNPSATPLWRLDFNVAQTRDPRGLRLDNVGERYELGLTVRYTLTKLSTGKVGTSGEVTSQVSYDAADAPYAGIAARQDSQERVAADAARRIHIQLAAWLARQAGS